MTEYVHRTRRWIRSGMYWTPWSEWRPMDAAAFFDEATASYSGMSREDRWQLESRRVDGLPPTTRAEVQG